MLNLTTVAIPNLISHELVIVSPMSSMSGYVTYIEYLSGNTKGATKNETLFNSPFKLGDVNETYTSDRVVESFEAQPTKVAWTPCVAGAVKAFDASGKAVEGITVKEDGTLKGDELASVRKVAYQYNNIVVPQNDLPMLKAEMKSIPLIAKARRIAVYYSQIAAFQA